MALSSQFYKDLSKIERKIRGTSVRQLKAVSMLIGITALLVVESLFLPNWAFWVISLPTSFALGFYPFLLLQNKWSTTKRKIELYFKEEDSYYRTNQIRRYEASEFIAKEGVKETKKEK